MEANITGSWRGAACDSTEAWLCDYLLTLLGSIDPTDHADFSFSYFQLFSPLALLCNMELGCFTIYDFKNDNQDNVTDRDQIIVLSSESVMAQRMNKTVISKRWHQRMKMSSFELWDIF